MTRRILMVCACAALGVAFAGRAAADDVSGKWKMTSKSPRGERVSEIALAQAGEKLLQHLNAILAGTIVPRSEIEAAAATYLAYYGNHIAREEENVLTRAAKSLTPADWKAVKNAAPEGRDPVFGDKPEARYKELRRQIALDA